MEPTADVKEEDHWTDWLLRGMGGLGLGLEVRVIRPLSLPPVPVKLLHPCLTVEGFLPTGFWVQELNTHHCWICCSLWACS